MSAVSWRPRGIDDSKQSSALIATITRELYPATQ